MPCSGCQQNKSEPTVVSTQPNRPLNPNLDAAIQALTRAQVYEVLPEHREYIPQIIEALQKMQHPTDLPLLTMLWNLQQAANQVVQMITCPYCQKHAYYDIVESISVAAEYEKGHVWHGLKLSVLKDLKKWRWAVQAGYHKLLLTQLARTRLHIRILLHQLLRS